MIIINAYAINAVGGGGRATRAIIQACAKNAASKMLVIADSAPEGWSVCTEVGFLTVANRSLWHKILGILSLRSIDRFSPFVEQEIERLACDCRVVVLNGAILGRFAPVFSAREVRVVTIHHNIDRDYYRANFRNTVAAMLLAGIASRNQRLAAVHSDQNIVLSRRDGCRLSSEYGARVESIRVMRPFDPKEADAGLPSAATERQPRAGLRLITTGSLDLPQTVSSVLWLVEHALPALRRIHHDVHLIIAGRNPAPALAGLRRPECSVVGNPSQAEMNRLIDESNIFVCPTSAGGGVKYKVLDGLRRGIPVVAHQNSCEGYEDAFSVAVRAYKDVETFCEQVGDLLRSLNSEQLRTQEIRRCYAANYSFDSGVRFWNMVLQE